MLVKESLHKVNPNKAILDKQEQPDSSSYLTNTLVVLKVKAEILINIKISQQFNPQFHYCK